MISTYALLKYLLLPLFTILILRYSVLPHLLEALIRVRIFSVSPKSVRGITWQPKHGELAFEHEFGLRASSKIERVGWRRSKRPGGVWMVRVRKDQEGDLDYEDEELEGNGDGHEYQAAEKVPGTQNTRSPSPNPTASQPRPKPKSRFAIHLSRTFRRYILYFMSIAVRQSPYIAHLIDIELKDVKFIYIAPDEETRMEERVEMTLSNLTLKFDVTFEEVPDKIIETPSPFGQQIFSAPTSPFCEGQGSDVFANTMPSSPVPMSPSLPFTHVMNNGLLSPPPSYGSFRDEKGQLLANSGSQVGGRKGSIYAGGIRKSRGAKVISLLLGRARGQAKMTLSLGKASVSYTKAPMTTTNLNHSTSKTSTPTHPPENFIELVDKSTLDTTVRFGGTRSILDEDTVDVEVEVSPLSVDVGKMLDVGEKLKRILKARKGVKGKEGREGKKSGPSTRSKELVNALHSVQIALPFSTIRYRVDMTAESPAVSAYKGHFDTSINGLFLNLQSASPHNHTRLRELFGNNKRHSSCITGISFGASMEELDLSWHGDDVKSQGRRIFDVAGLDFHGYSTWRPRGWGRPVQLFAQDQNRSVVEFSLGASRILAKVSVPLLAMLKIRSAESRPAKKGKKKVTKPILVDNLPKVYVHADLGALSAVVLSSDEEVTSQVELHTGGLEMSISSDHRDICAVRSARVRDQKAFGAEEATRKKAEENDFADAVDARHEGDVAGEREFPIEAGSLVDDASVAIDWRVMLLTQRSTATISSTHEESSSSEILRLGSINVNAEGTVKGGHVDGSDDAVLMPDTNVGEVQIMVDQGLDVAIWHKETLQYLHELKDSFKQMPKSHKKDERAKQQDTAEGKTALARLPSGLRTRVALPAISMLIAGEDPNPNCKHKLSRGLYLQLNLSLDFCSYNDIRQTRPHKMDIHPVHRRNLRLPADVGEQASALHNRIQKAGGTAAHVAINATSVSLSPIYNAATFRSNRKPQLKPIIRVTTAAFFPKRTRFPSYAGWDFQQMRLQPQPPHEMANSLDPLPTNPYQQATKPLLSIDKFNGSANLQETDDKRFVSLAGDVGASKASLDVSHVYCGLLALRAVIPRRPDAPKAVTSPATSGTKPPIHFSAKLRVRTVQGEFALPLKERLFFYLDTMSATATKGFQEFAIDNGMFFVPSPRAPGTWEEFGRMRLVTVAVSKEADKAPRISLNAAALRVRVPFRYEISKLILNFSVMIKALKLLIGDIYTERFLVVRKPGREAPKKVPDISVKIAYLSFEIKDDPLETKLNLIWRVGLNEQGDRIERMEAFAAKTAILEASRSRSGSATHDVEELKERWGFDDTASRDVDSAAYNLAWYNAKAWKKRFDKAMHTQTQREEAVISRVYGKRIKVEDLPIEVKPGERFAPLFRAKVINLDLQIRSPGFDDKGIRNHMESLAGPFPEHTDFSLLVPLQLQLKFFSLDCSLRDYPLPLFRVGPQSTKEDVKKTDVNFEANITVVVAEELAGDDTYVLLPCPVIPKDLGAKGAAGLEVQVAKTIMPVKTYLDMKVNIATDVPTDFTWGNSYQPAMEDLVKAFETFTHPPRDPSPKMGSWDKFRLTLHWRIGMDFEGPVHLHLKGSRNPYHITGFGAGFVLAWMGKVRLAIGQTNAQREVIQIHSDQMFLSIPDLSAFIDNAATGTHDDLFADAGKSSNALPSLLDRRGTKICARFVGGVRVGFAFKFERTCRPHSCTHGCQGGLSERKCRFFDFPPHHAVVLRTKEVVEAESRRLGRQADSYEGFRSDFIHFSPSIETFGRVPEAKGEGEAKLCNSFHFTPKGFAHFFAWWRLFNHVMSLPIRQGSLFPKAPPPSRKFGRSLATIKYRFDIPELFISHFYEQFNKTDSFIGRQTSLGVKAFISHFKADLHQREQTKIIRNDALNKVAAVKHKPFYAADIVLDEVRVRAVNTVFDNAVGAVLDSNAQNLAGVEAPQGIRVADLQDGDSHWYSFDDYVDTDRRPVDQNPYMLYYELGDILQFHFSRWVPTLNLKSGIIEKMKAGQWTSTDMEASKFGSEPSHRCLIGNHPGVDKVRLNYTTARLNELKEELDVHTGNGHGDADPQAHVAKTTLLHHKIQVLQKFRDELHDLIDASNERKRHRSTSNAHVDYRDTETEGGEFQNIWQVFAPRFCLNNQSRNVLMKYYYSSRLRKGLEYHLTNKALKIFREQLSALARPVQKMQRVPDLHLPKSNGSTLEWVADKAGNAIAREFLKMVLGEHAKDEKTSTTNRAPSADVKGDWKEVDAHAGLPKEFSVTKGHYFLFLGPQLALSSEVDQDSTVLLTLEKLNLESHTVHDDEYVGDDVNSTVMRRTYASLSGLQGFYPSRGPVTVNTDATGRKDLAFLPLEILLDAKCESTDFDRLLPRTDGRLQYDKFNQLRLGNELPADRDGSEVLPEHIRHRQDLAMLHVPRFAVVADAQHFSALYNVITNLILYQDPEQRHRSQQLDTYMYAFDKRDSLRYVTEVAQLQLRIRELESLYRAYYEHYDHLTNQGKLGLIAIRSDLFTSVESLNMLFEAVAAQQSHAEGSAALKSSLKLEAHAGELAWFMFGQDALLAKLAIKGLHFSWLRKKDSSTENSLLVEDLQALNTSQDAVFPEILAKYDKGSKQDKAMICVQWSVLAPVGGITIIERFALDLHPIRLQLEKKLGRQVMAYIFVDKANGRKRTDSQANSKQLLSPDGEDTSRRARGGDDNASVVNFSINSRRKKKGSESEEPRPALSRTSSFSDTWTIDSTSSKPPLTREKSNTNLRGESDRQYRLMEAEEMHSRAASNRTFVGIEVSQTTLVLSYRGDKPRSITDLFDFKFSTPSLTYVNKTWSFENLVQQLKKDILKSAWSQKGALIKEVFKHRSGGRNKTPHERMGPWKPLTSKSQTSLLIPASGDTVKNGHLNVTPLDQAEQEADQILGNGLTGSPDEELQQSPLDRIKSTLSVHSVKKHSDKDEGGDKEKGRLGKFIEKHRPHRPGSTN